MKHALQLLGAAALCLTTGAALAQAYPTKPIKLVVGFAPGGATDIVARQIAGALGTVLGQQVLVDNRGGGNGYPAWQHVARAPADGHTLLLGENSMAIVPGVYPQQPFKPQNEFAPVGFLGTAPFMLIVNNGVKAQSVKELVALAKAQPGKLQYGSAGNGTPTQLSFEALKMAAGIDAMHVPYKGGGPAMVDLLGGHITAMFAALSVAKPHVEAGRVRALALTGPRRSAVFPNLPTFDEAGVPLPDLMLGQWWGLFAPNGTPPEVIDKLNAAFAQALAQPEVRARLAGLSIEIETGAPALLQTRYAAELARWARVIERAKVVGD